MRIGLMLPATPPTQGGLGIAEAAGNAERAGCDGVWVNDHVVMPPRPQSRYPFTGGEPHWPLDSPFIDPIVAMALAVAGTQRVEVGVAVLTVVLRHPVILAKQIASLDSQSGGRVVLGVGAGWLREEFEVLGVPFEDRGRRLEDALAIMAGCWTGRSQEHEGLLSMPGGAYCYPVPGREPPVLFGVGSPRGLERAGRIGAGWIGVIDATRGDSPYLTRVATGGIEELAGQIEAVRRAADAAGRSEAVGRMVCHVLGPREDVAAALPDLARVGVNEVIVHDVDWPDPAPTLDLLRAACEDIP